jgi:hypothetical protein
MAKQTQKVNIVTLTFPSLVRSVDGILVLTSSQRRSDTVIATFGENEVHVARHFAWRLGLGGESTLEASEDVVDEQTGEVLIEKGKLLTIAILQHMLTSFRSAYTAAKAQAAGA